MANRLSDLATPAEIVNDDNLPIPVTASGFGAVLVGTTLTRPADTIPYAAGDLIANSTTAGSVAPIQFANAARTPAGVLRIERVRLQKSTTSLTNAAFRVHFYSATVTPANGDNGAWSTPRASYIGAIDVTMDRALSDGAQGSGVPLVGPAITCRPNAGTTLFALLESRAAYTPGNAEQFVVTLEAQRF